MNSSDYPPIVLCAGTTETARVALRRSVISDFDIAGVVALKAAVEAFRTSTESGAGTPDVVVLDTGMLSAAVKIARSIHEVSPETPVVIITENSVDPSKLAEVGAIGATRDQVSNAILPRLLNDAIANRRSDGQTR